MPQLHRVQRLALGLLTAGLVAGPQAVRAQDDWDKQSYWFGFLLGSGTTVCELLKAGLLTRNDARDWLQTLLQNDQDIPAVSLRTARSTLAESEKQCPLPAKP
jgi:hypothetical protein